MTIGLPSDKDHRQPVAKETTLTVFPEGGRPAQSARSRHRWSLADSIQTREQSRWALVMFFLYRLVLSTTMLVSFVTGLAPSFLGKTEPRVFLVSSLLFFGLVLINGLMLFRKHLDVEPQTHFMVATDILAITLLMHSSGGVESGLGMLLVVSVAAGSLLTEGRTVLLMAAWAAIAALGEQAYSHWAQSFERTAYTQAGMLGVLVFAMAILAHTLASQARRNEELAGRRSLDLANLEQLNDYIIQHAHIGVLVLNPRSQIHLANDAAIKMLGAEGNALGQPLKEVSADLSALYLKWRRTPEQPVDPVYTQGDKELLVQFTPLGEEGHAGTIVSIEDNSTRSAEAQKDKLVSLGRLTASIAHEIRNPLGAIGHAGQLLGESPDLDPTDRRLVEIIRNNTTRLNDIIENVLQLSRRNPSQPKTLLLQECLAEFVSQYRQSHPHFEEAFVINLPSQHLYVRADPSQMHQVLTVLCDNSLTHFNGPVEILRIQLRAGLTDTNARVVLEVVDNGPGIPPEKVPHLFEPFFTTRAQGTGLGLYIAKELCDVNEVHIKYRESKPRGSCFRLTFLQPSGGQDQAATPG